MKRNSLTIFAFALTAAVSGLEAAPSQANPLAGEAPLLIAQNDCYAIGQRIAGENGGTLAKATPETRGGRTVCRIVIVVPGQDGGRPRRMEFDVNA
ncbi:hypothetical protein [Nitratireductor basaltis]|uniref:Secreted protein n=1 Tax=Nitratireductor basaltis TaxID=472175 RepID=A0A084UCF4_9HYPH|nr:hypothetical protein [Nitratireductor basaltis]KFB10640.1 hypothetical protein EL18_01678 [Nitratireductor basaltis]